MAKWLTMTLALFALGPGTCLSLIVGCVAAPKTPEELIILVQAAADIAHNHGVSYFVEAEFGGDPGLSYAQKITLHSGIKFRFQMYGNAGISQANKGLTLGPFRYDQVSRAVDWMIANPDMVNELNILALPLPNEEVVTESERIP